MEGDTYIIGLFIFLGFILLARVLNEKANKSLTVEKKAELVDLFSNSRIIVFIILIVILLAYFLILRTTLFSPSSIMTIYIGVLVIYITGYTAFAYKKLKSHEFPESYIKTYLLSAVIRMIGVVVFLTFIQ